MARLYRHVIQGVKTVTSVTTACQLKEPKIKAKDGKHRCTQPHSQVLEHRCTTPQPGIGAQVYIPTQPGIGTQVYIPTQPYSQV